MAPMARIQAGPAALRRVAGGGNSLSRRLAHPSICALPTRSVVTNATTQEPKVEFPASIPPVPVPSRSNVDDRRKAIKSAKPFSDFLTDTFNRQHDYLRISITERCNLRCLYCMPEEGIPLSPSANMLTTPEIFYLSSLFVSQGVTKIRLTGGEPTVRRDVVPLMQQIGSLRPKGLRELALTTNGISLHRKLDAMVEAGLTGVNLSLDTLDPFQFQIMTRRKGFDAVMKSIDRILEMNKLGANVKLKVNCVVMRGLNEREILPFVEMGREKDIEVRFIEYMPFGGNKWSENKMISFQEMLDIIRTKYPGLRPVPGHKNDTSKTYEVPGFVGKVGFITSMTNDFCGTCNRLRITSDGNLKVCLHGNAEVSLRAVLRQGNNGEPIDQEAFERIKQIEMDRHEGRLSDETILGWGQRERELLDVVGAAVKRKAEKHADLNDLASMENRPMILIDNKPLSSLDSQWPLLRRPLNNSSAFLARSRKPSSPLPYLNAIPHPTATVVRAFSTSPVSPAKKLYQLKKLQEAKKILKAAKTAKNTQETESDPNNMQDFLEEVKVPQESDRVLRRIEAKIHELQGRISEVVDQFPKAPKAQPPNHVSDALDAINYRSGASKESMRRARWRARRKAALEEQEAFAANRAEQLNEIGKLLTEYKKQVAAVNEQVRKQAEVRKRKEEVLAEKRALLKQLKEHEEAERMAKMVIRAPEHRNEGKDGMRNGGRELDDILDGALGRVNKEPRHPAKKVRERDVPAKEIVMRQAGLSSVSVLERNRGRDGAAERRKSDDALVDPIMDMERVVDASTPTTQSYAGDAPSLTSPSNSNEKLRLNVPQSGFIPIDSDLIDSFDSPIPQLQQQIFALRDRLKSSYPRIDTLPFDIWTSNNKRTLQTWLKILVSRWQARFDDVDLTGQLEKSVVDERLRVVLDQMVRDHDLSNDAAERMAMRWYEVFDKRSAMNGDAEGVLDWEEMEAGGMGFLANEANYSPPQQQQPQPDSSTGFPSSHNKASSSHSNSPSSPILGLVSRRTYSTSSHHPPLASESRSKRPSNPTDNAKPTSTLTQGLSAETKQHPSLPHLTSSGSAHMVSVSDKEHTTRTAIAVGTVYFTNPTPLRLIQSNSLKKGDVLGTSRIAGIMAAKKCPDIIPLCHPIALTHVGVELRAFDTATPSSSSPRTAGRTSTVGRTEEQDTCPPQLHNDLGHGGIQIEAKVQCVGPTGVEMEALTAVMGAALSVVDMCKAVDKFQRVHDVRVVLKEGGKSGVWREEGWGSWQH